MIKAPSLGPGLPGSSAELDRQPLGTLDEVKQGLAPLGAAVWLDWWVGFVDGDGWTAEISLHVGSPIDELTLRIQGRDEPTRLALDLVRAICSANGWRAVDLDAWAVLL